MTAATPPEPKTTRRRIRAVAAILALSLAAGVAGCGRKPSRVDPPEGVDKNSFPLNYPMRGQEPSPVEGKVPPLRHDRFSSAQIQKREGASGPDLPTIHIPDPLAPLPTPSMPSMTDGGVASQPQLPTLNSR